MRGAPLVVAWILGILTGCQARTELMVGFATDMPAPDMLDRISFLGGPEGVPLIDVGWDLPADELPGSFAIVADGAATVTLTLIGLKGDSVVVTRETTLPIVEGKTLFYRMGLTAVCRDSVTDCGGDECIEGACVRQVITGEMLPEYRDELVTTLTCVGAATYINTTTSEPMPVSADAASCPPSACVEGTCLRR